MNQIALSSEMVTKKIKHYFKHREMLDCENVGHFLLMISGVVVK